MKKKPLRANHVTYITKALTKAIMKRSELESKYLKNKTSEKFRNLTKNKEISAVNYIKKKKKYYERLDLNNVTDKKKFWKIVKSFFQKMPQVENDEIISDKSQVTNSFSNFFENAIHSLGVKTNEYSNDNYGLKNPVEIAIKKYQQHPGINLTKENITKNESFYFLPTEQESILKVIINLDNKKKKELLRIFLLAISRMYQIYVALFQQIPGMREFYLTKIFPKILNQQIPYRPKLSRT